MGKCTLASPSNQARLDATRSWEIFLKATSCLTSLASSPSWKISTVYFLRTLPSIRKEASTFRLRKMPSLPSVTRPLVYMLTGPKLEKWSLVSPGLQYPCEAHKKLNEAFAERYDDFEFPVTAATDNLGKISSFLHMKRSMALFTQVKEVADFVAACFEGYGTLADCSPHGMVANQVMVCLSPPEHLPDPTNLHCG